MRSASAYSSGFEQPHFLDSCFLCQRQLSQNKDIYMYRGDTPFCSQECRQEQIEMDEVSEKRWRLSSKKSNALRNQNKDSTQESETKKAVRRGTVAVA